MLDFEATTPSSSSTLETALLSGRHKHTTPSTTSAATTTTTPRSSCSRQRECHHDDNFYETKTNFVRQTTANSTTPIERRRNRAKDEERSREGLSQISNRQTRRAILRQHLAAHSSSSNKKSLRSTNAFLACFAILFILCDNGLLVRLATAAAGVASSRLNEIDVDWTLSEATGDRHVTSNSILTKFVRMKEVLRFRCPSVDMPLAIYMVSPEAALLCQLPGSASLSSSPQHLRHQPTGPLTHRRLSRPKLIATSVENFEERLSKATLIGYCGPNTGEPKISIRQYSPLPGKPVFAEGQTYYFISASNGSAEGLNNRHGGLCQTRGLRLRVVILPSSVAAENRPADEWASLGAGRERTLTSPSTQQSTSSDTSDDFSSDETNLLRFAEPGDDVEEHRSGSLPSSPHKPSSSHHRTHHLLKPFEGAQAQQQEAKSAEPILYVVGYNAHPHFQHPNTNETASASGGIFSQLKNDGSRFASLVVPLVSATAIAFVAGAVLLALFLAVRRVRRRRNSSSSTTSSSSSSASKRRRRRSSASSSFDARPIGCCPVASASLSSSSTASTHSSSATTSASTAAAAAAAIGAEGSSSAFSTVTTTNTRLHDLLPPPPPQRQRAVAAATTTLAPNADASPLGPWCRRELVAPPSPPALPATPQFSHQQLQQQSPLQTMLTMGYCTCGSCQQQRQTLMPSLTTNYDDDGCFTTTAGK